MKIFILSIMLKIILGGNSNERTEKLLMFLPQYLSIGVLDLQCQQSAVHIFLNIRLIQNMQSEYNKMDLL